MSKTQSTDDKIIVITLHYSTLIEPTVVACFTKFTCVNSMFDYEMLFKEN